jgi:hypothetical protein
MPFSRRAPSRALLVAVLSFTAWAAATCSASSDFEGGSAGASTSGSGGSGGGVLFGDGGPGGLDGSAACGLITEQAKSTPLNLYIAFDKSSSMVGTKWTSAKAGLSVFVNDTASAGIKVALNFFPLTDNPTCDQFAYKPPLVPFGVLPENAKAIISALDVTTPDGFLTPIYPALGGAILAAKEQAQKNPGQEAAVLLVTDGQPQGPSGTCASVDPEDPNVIADLAKAGTMLGIKSFVIGLPGVDQTIANQIAAAGGTDAAILAGGVDVESAFQDALTKVRGKALACEYDLPEKVSGGEIEVGLVNVLLTPKDGQTSVLPQNASCSGPGWKYDAPSTPKRIIFCPESCDAVKADFGAKVQILLGCKTEVVR